MVQLSELFGVSLDYLLKDNISSPQYIESLGEEESIKRVSMEEANNFFV